MHVIFEITTDPDLLSQYYKLRENSFRRILALPEFCGKEEELDRQSDILIARIGEQCLGGVRICGANNLTKSPLKNQVENESAQLPELDLDQYGHCQWMRLTMCPDSDISISHLHKQFFLALTKFSVSLGYRYGFCLSSKAHQRFYKRFFSQYDCDYWSCRGVTVECEDTFTDLDHLLCVTDMHSLEDVTPDQNNTEFNVTYHLNTQPDKALYYCKS